MRTTRPLVSELFNTWPQSSFDLGSGQHGACHFTFSFMVPILRCSYMDGESRRNLSNSHTHVFRWKQARDPRLAALNKLTYSVWISRGAGLALSLDSSLLLIPMCRETLRWLRPKMRWLRLEESEWFHRQVAYSLLFYTCVHVSSHYVK